MLLSLGASAVPHCQVNSFHTFVKKKTREASTALIERLTTVRDESESMGGPAIGNAWSRPHYGGAFRLVAPTAAATAVSLVFVQTRDRNTGGIDPGAFGGGATDKHLIYEGLSRVAADAVLSGSGSLHLDAFFSVWHPELVALRASLGLPRHPTQIVVSKRGRFDFNTRLFNVPDVPVFLIAGDECVARHAAELRARSWVRVLRLSADGVRSALDQLRVAEGIERVSAIGGRVTATQLVNGGLAQDIYLTTTPVLGGEPGTPWYSGASSPRLRVVTEKKWQQQGSTVRFEHILID